MRRSVLRLFFAQISVIRGKTLHRSDSGDTLIHRSEANASFAAKPMNTTPKARSIQWP